MVTRRLAALSLLPLLAVPRGGGQAKAVVGPEPARNCGDPGGRVIACDALRDTLTITGDERCPLCGGRHRLPSTP
jgi:hypothetical protein